MSKKVGPLPRLSAQAGSKRWSHHPSQRLPEPPPQSLLRRKLCFNASLFLRVILSSWGCRWTILAEKLGQAPCQIMFPFLLLKNLKISRSPSGGVRWRRRSGQRGSGLLGWAGRSRVASCPGVLPARRRAWRAWLGGLGPGSGGRSWRPERGLLKAPGRICGAGGHLRGVPERTGGVNRAWTETEAYLPSYSCLGSFLWALLSVFMS